MDQTTVLRQPRIHRFALDGLIALGGSAFLALLSQWALPLPFSPVPVTLQTLGVCLLGGLLGGRLALLSVFAYLVEGSLGLPVFAGGLMTMGYRFAFLPAAWIMGKMVEKNFSFSRIIVASSVSTGLILVLGAAWLGLFIGVPQAITAGILPFLVGSVAKILLGAVILKGSRRLF